MYFLPCWQAVPKALLEAVRRGCESVLPLKELPDVQAQMVSTSEAAAEELRHYPAAGRWQRLRYHGDWMHRPIASNEFAPLARLLVGLSEAINRRWVAYRCFTKFQYHVYTAS